MVSVTYSTLHSILHLSIGNISQTDTESILDQAIDLLNLYANQSISNLSAGSVTVTSKQRGAILEVAKAVYYRDYASQIPSSAGDIKIDVSPTLEPSEVAKDMAARLVSRSILRT